MKVVQGLTPVPYVDENGAAATATNYIQMEPDTTQWNGGVYVVRGNVTINGGVTVTGEMPSIILCDKASLTVNGGITLPDGRTEALTIYGQTDGTGAMTVKNSGGAAFSSGNLAVIRLLRGTLTATGKDTAFSNVTTWNQQDGNDEIKCIATGSELEVRADGTTVPSVTLSRCTEHQWGYAQHKSAAQHLKTCDLCGYNPNGAGKYENCVYDTFYGADESGHKSACVCNRTERGAALIAHTPDYIPNPHGKTHGYRCTVCDFVSDAATNQHTYVDGVCSACKYACPHESIDKTVGSDTEGVCDNCGKRIYVARLVLNEGTIYETVEYGENVKEALERYKNGGPVVTLLCDVDMGTEALVVTAEVTGKLLDLNGHRLSGSGDTVFQIYKRYGFTVRNGTIENTGDGDAIQLIRVYSGSYFDGNLTLEDVNVTAAKGWAVKAAYKENDIEGEVNPGNGELYIKSGTFKGGLNGGALRIIQISGGTFIANPDTHSIMNPGPVIGPSALQKYLAPEHTYADANGNAINYFSSENHTRGDKTNSLGYRMDIWLNAETVTITEHTTHDIDRETGKCIICGAPCPHVALDDAGFCTACGARRMFCEVEGTLYPTIYKALEAVTNRTDNPVIKLLDNYTDYVTNIGTANGFTLDLNGFRLTDGQMILYEDRNLTIIDSSEKKTGSVGTLWAKDGHATIQDGSYAELIASKADSIKITGEGTVKIRKISMTGYTDGSNKKVVANLLEPGYAVYLVDENASPATYTLVDGYHNQNNTSGGYLQQYLPGGYKDSPAVLPAGQYYTVAAHEHDFADSTQTTCACGLSCDHATVNADGVCAACHAVFTAKVTDANGNVSYYADGFNDSGNTRSGLDFAFAAAVTGSTVTVLGGDSITACLDGGKSLTLALNGKDVDTIYVGRSEGANSLTVTGAGNIRSLYVHQNNKADLTGWTGKMEQLYVYSGGKATLDGGTFGKVALNGNTAGSLLVSGYAFQYEDGSYAAYDATDDLTKTVSVVPCDYEGWYSSDSGAVCPYCAQPGAVRVPVKLDGTAQYAFYLTLQKAIDEQNRSDNKDTPITLLKNISGDCAINSDVFIDMGGHSINGTLTVKNATASFSGGKESRITAVTMSGSKARFGQIQRSSIIPQIGTLTIADGANWGSILPTEFDRHGYKLPKDDDSYEWRDSDTADAAASTMTNVSITRLPIPNTTLLLWANGKTTHSEPIGTTVRLEAGCAIGSSVTFYIQKEGSDTPVTLAGEDLNFGKYSADYQFSEVGKYTVWFVGTKDGYSARSVDEPLTITKLEIPADAITPPTPYTDLVYNGEAQELVTAGQLDPQYGTIVFGDIGDQLYEFSAEIPKAASAGTYQYYYLIRGNGDYADARYPKSVTTIIAKRELTVTDVEVKTKTYDGTNTAEFGAVTFGNALNSEKPGYVASGVYNDCNAGDNKTVDVKVELRGGSDKNYMFAGGAANTTFRKTGLSILKAPAPTVTETASLTITNDLAKTYTVQLPALPELESPCEYGDFSYQVEKVALPDGYYTDGASVSEDGKTLTLPINAVKSSAAGAIGTATVKVTTTNYEDITLTVHVSAKNKLIPEGSPKLTPSAITYGQTVGIIALSGDMKAEGKTVTGTFTWDAPDAKPNKAGSYDAAWTFTPTDTAEYQVVHGSTTITVNRAPLTDVSVLQATALTYNGQPQQATVTTTGKTVDGTPVVFRYSTEPDGGFTKEVPQFTNAGTYTVYYQASDENQNHVVSTGSFTVTIAARNISEADIKLGAALTYNGQQQTKEITSVTVDGLTVTYDVTGDKQTNAGDYKLTITGTGNFTGSVMADYSIAAKDITNAAIKLGKALTYNGKLQTQSIESVTVDGLPVTYDVTGDKATNAGDYTLTVTANGNFAGTLTADYTVAQKDIQDAVVDVESPVYTGKIQSPKINSVTVDDMTLVEGTDYAALTRDAVSAGSYAMKLIGMGNFTGTADRTFTVLKAEALTVEPIRIDVTNDYAASYTVALRTALNGVLPEGCSFGTVNYGSPSISDPSGYCENAAIRQDILTMAVAQVPSDTEGLVATVEIPVETANYQQMTVTVELYAVNKLIPTGAPTPSKTTLNYGDALSSIRLRGSMRSGSLKVPGTFAWAEPDLRPVAGEYEATWVFTPNDSKYATVTGTITITVKEPSQPTYKVGGIVKGFSVADNEELAPISGAVVTICKGLMVLGGRRLTDENGLFDLDGVLPGVYNVVVAYQGKTVTTKVELTDHDVDLTVLLPEEDVNSELEIRNAGRLTRNAVVGGLDDEASLRFKDGAALDGGSVLVSMEIREQPADKNDEVQNAIRQAVKTRNLEFVDLTLTLVKNGVKETLPESGTVLEIILSCDANRKLVVARQEVDENGELIVKQLTESDTGAEGTYLHRQGE